MKRDVRSGQPEPPDPQTALRRSEERFRIVAETISDLVFEWDVARDAILWHGSAANTFFGYSLDELPVRRSRWREFIHPEDRESATDNAGRAVAEGAMRLVQEYRVVGKGGSVYHVTSQSSILRGEEGSLARVIGAITDITKRKQAEEALRANEARMRAVFGALVEGVVFLNVEGIVEAVNDSVQRIIGHTLEALSDPDRDPRLRIVRGDGTPIPVEEQPAIVALRTGETVRNREMGVPRPDGSIVWLSVNAQPVHDDRGNLLGAVASLFDITESRRAEMERTAALEENARLLRAQAEAAAQQRAFLRDVLYSVTEGRLRLCGERDDLPTPLPPASDPIPLSPPRLREVRHKVQEVAVGCGFPDERWHDLVSAVGECAMNAIQHGGEMATARIRAEGDTVQVWIEDRGKGIAVSDLPRATLLKGHSGAASFGHGFYVMLRTVDIVYLLTGPQGTTVVLEQKIAPPEPVWLQGAGGGLD